MKRHPADLIALIAGLIFVVIGSAYLSSGDVDFGADGTQWLLPLALIGLGIAGLAGSIAGARRARNGNGNGEPEPVTGSEPAAQGQPGTGSEPATEGQPVTGSEPASQDQPVTGSEPATEGQPVAGEDAVAGRETMDEQSHDQGSASPESGTHHL